MSGLATMSRWLSFAHAHIYGSLALAVCPSACHMVRLAQPHCRTLPSRAPLCAQSTAIHIAFAHRACSASACRDF
jgi:hypothetical protein